MKLCNTCEIEKDDDDFAWRNRAKGTRNTKCKACQKIYAKEHYSGNKQYYKEKSKRQYNSVREWYVDFMIGKKCGECGEDHIATLDWHHIDPTTKRECVTRLIKNGSKRVVLEEIDKCICLCSNCHRKLHHESVSLTPSTI